MAAQTEKATKQSKTTPSPPGRLVLKIVSLMMTAQAMIRLSFTIVSIPRIEMIFGESTPPQDRTWVFETASSLIDWFSVVLGILGLTYLVCIVSTIRSRSWNFLYLNLGLFLVFELLILITRMGVWEAMESSMESMM